MAGETTPAKKSAVEKKQEGLKNFKFEANISVFGSEVLIKPMEDDQIGFRAPQGEKGIVITQKTLEQSGLIKAGGTAAGLLPQETDIRTLVYNRKTGGVEIAVTADFFGPITAPMVDNLIAANNGASSADDKKAIIKQLYDWVITERQLTIATASATLAADASDYATQLALYYKAAAGSAASSVTAAVSAYKGFILNRYPQIFTVNTVSIYLGAEQKKDPPAAVPPAS